MRIKKKLVTMQKEQGGLACNGDVQKRYSNS